MENSSIDRYSSMAGTVKFYKRHLILCSGRTEWPSKIEDLGGFTASLVQSVNAANFPETTRVSACAAPSPGPGTDLLLFPQKIKISAVTEPDIPTLIDYLKGYPVDSLSTSNYPEHLFLVCGHLDRDVRCGRCGPGLLVEIQQQLPTAYPKSRAKVYLSSHLGGHRFAGVVVCYPSGNWYGRVTEAAIPALLKAELLDRKPLAGLWRGRIGLSIEQQKALAEEMT